MRIRIILACSAASIRNPVNISRLGVIVQIGEYFSSHTSPSIKTAQATKLMALYRSWMAETLIAAYITAPYSSWLYRVIWQVSHL